MNATRKYNNENAKQKLLLFLLLLSGCSSAEKIEQVKPTITFPMQHHAVVEEAVELRQEREEAEQQNMLRLAEQYRYGRHLEQDIEEAVRIYETLAAKGNKQAIHELATAYDMGGWHYHHPRLAVHWWQKQAELGDVEAMLQLGSAYSRAYGTEIDIAKAKHWFNKAIQRQPSQRKAVILILTTIDNHACQQLGLYYLQAAIAVHDRSSAHLLYTYYLSEQRDEALLDKVAKIFEQDEQADVYLSTQLALRYQDVKNDDKAIEWMQFAAKSGIDDAMLYLAKAYDTGLYLERNPQLAVKWYLKAASKGNNEAQYQLGMAYARGSGVAQNEEKALYWLVKSGKMTMLEAQQQLDMLTAAVK